MATPMSGIARQRRVSRGGRGCEQAPAAIPWKYDVLREGGFPTRISPPPDRRAEPGSSILLQDALREERGKRIRIGGNR